jgi:hypothetical protein
VSRLACVLFCSSLLCAPSARAEGARVLAVDHRVSVDGSIAVETRWLFDAPVHEGDYFELARPLPQGSTLESTDVSPLRDAERRISALVARRDLPRELSLSSQRADSKTGELPLAAPDSSAVTRVRLPVPQQVVVQGAHMVQRLGIRTTSDMSRSERRLADQLLDGRRGHRRLGALYVRGRDGPLELLPGSDAHRQTLSYVVVLLFLLVLALLFLLRARVRRNMREERIDAYLRRSLSESEHALLTLEEE